MSKKGTGSRGFMPDALGTRPVPPPSPPDLAAVPHYTEREERMLWVATYTRMLAVSNGSSLTARVAANQAVQDFNKRWNKD